MSSVRLVSYLSPGLPATLFQVIGATLAQGLGRAVEVGFVDLVSGPAPGEWPEGADLAFMCAPAYVALRRAGEGSLVPAGPVFADPRSGGGAVYFSDVIVRRGSAVRSIDDLVGARWAVNDSRSLSGYRCVVDSLGADTRMTWSGGHLRSIEMVRSGEVDAAAIDANVLARIDTDDIRVVHSFGPHPVQPLVARNGSVALADIAGLLIGRSFPDWGVVGFAATSDDHYPDSLA